MPKPRGRPPKNKVMDTECSNCMAWYGGNLGECPNCGYTEPVDYPIPQTPALPGIKSPPTEAKAIPTVRRILNHFGVGATTARQTR